jgi:hypothetical protein
VDARKDGGISFYTERYREAVEDFDDVGKPRGQIYDVR